jgi:hypothetical protein
MSNHISIVSTNHSLSLSEYTSTLRFHVPGFALSTTVTSAPGTRFVDGSVSKSTQGYVTVGSNPLDSNVWNIINEFPYTGFAELNSLIIETLGVRSTLYIKGHTDISGSLSSLGTFITPSLTHLGLPVTSSSNLISTVDGLGHFYISSGSNNIASTIAGLGNTYISSAGLTSTFNGLGLTYVSTGSIISSSVGYSNYVTVNNLVSTVNGASGIKYISTASLFSTVVGLSNTYITSNVKRSTVAGFTSLEKDSLISSVNGLGYYYVSSSSLQSTVDGLGHIYISSGHLETYVSTFTTATVRDILIEMVTNLGSGSIKYVSSTQLFSTVSGLGSIGYISNASLTSTVKGIQDSQTSNMVSTVAGLGSIPYISREGVTSTISGLSNIFSSNLLSTTRGLGSAPGNYISTAQLTSTVQGLGSLPGTGAYISTDSLVSTTISYDTSALFGIVRNAGQFYVSTSGIVSTTSALLTSFSNTFLSTVQGLGSLPSGQGYISSQQLVSTVEGLGSLPGTNAYISTASLVSSYISYIRPGVETIIISSGNIYLSTQGIISTTTGLLTGFSNSLVSTFQGLGTTGYLSVANLFSTVQGLGSLPGTGAYISTASLVSTYNGYTLYNQTQVNAMVANIPIYYLPLTGLASTSSGLQSNFSNAFLSTLSGLGNSGFITLTQLNDLVSAFESAASQTYTTNTLINPITATTVNTSNIIITRAESNYFTRSNLVSTTTALRREFSNTLHATFTGLNSAGYINKDNLISTVFVISENTIRPSQLTSTSVGYSNNQQANILIMIQNAGQTYVSTSGLISSTLGLQTSSSNSLISTIQGLGSSPGNYISTPQFISTFNGLGSLPGSYISTASIRSTFTSLSNSFATAALTLFENNLGSIYISTPGLVSTVVGLSSNYIQIPQLTSTVINLGGYYISTPNLTSTITGISVLHSNSTKNILTSTVGGLGQSYLSTLSFQSNIKLSNFQPLLTRVGTISYSNTVNLFSNAYIYYTSPNTLASTSNFYEGTNISMINTPMYVIGSTIATTVRTIGYGSNYLYGDGSYMTVTSDRILKKDIEAIRSVEALEQVISMRGVYYTKIGDKHPYIGCIAQEVEALFPQVITTHPSVEPKDLKSMKYESLLAPLVESVKELANTHSTLKYLVEKKYGNIQ